MKLNPSIVAFYLWICCKYLGVHAFVSSFTKIRFHLSSERFSKEGDKADIYNMNSCVHPNSLLPGDPSLILTTNLDLGEKKAEIMKGISEVIAAATKKPESYVSVCVNDNASVIFGGTDAPCALGNMCSIGAISMESNGEVQKGVTELLEPFGLDAGRIYINFFDVPRANVGWNKATFAG